MASLFVEGSLLGLAGLVLAEKIQVWVTANTGRAIEMKAVRA